MARNKVIVGNWKMNKTPAEAKAFMVELTKLVKENKTKIGANIKYGIAAPSVDLVVVKEKKVATGLKFVAAQNVHQKANGAFTGELSIDMVKAAGANAVVIGHSERRAMFAETDADVNAKAKALLAAKMTPILCFGETKEEFESKKTKAVIKKQVSAAIKGMTDEEVKQIIFAYEPIWAIGTGLTATSAQAEEMCKYTRTLLPKAVASKTIIQYGGSVKPENIAELMAMPNIDGALVGGASVDAKSFVKLLTLNK